MDNQAILTELKSILGEDNVAQDELMSRHTTFKIGGKADYFVTPENVDQIQKLVVLLNQEQIPFYIIGNGSNLLVHDNGFRGVIIQLYQKFSTFEVLADKTLLDQATSGQATSEQTTSDQTDVVLIKAQSGVMLSRLGNEMAALGLAGFEFATGIPGTLGGAVRMNAGAYGGEIKDVIVNATVMDRDGNVFILDKEQLKLGYRTSVVDTEQYIVLEAVIQLQKGNKDAIVERIKELSAKRREKQPLEYPSAGSTFKRPEGYFAGKLISDAGLKGFRVGGAMVSEKHAGFVINAGNATANDVIELTNQVRDKIYELNHVTLELEVKKLGF